MERLRREIRGFSLQDTLTLDNFKIVEYYPYTSIVNLRIVESDRDGHSPFDEWLNSLWDEISTWLEREKKIHRDNKTAVNILIMIEELKKMFAQLGDKEQVDVMVDFYNYIYSIQQDEFKKRIGVE